MTMTQRFGMSVAATVLSVTGVLVPAANAQERPAARAEVSQAATPSEGMTQGIKVKGHWVIEVRNPDGGLVRRHEFDNALQIDGQFSLGEALLRRTTLGRWTVIVFDGLCPANLGSTVCILTEADANLVSETDVASGTNVFRTLTIGSPNSLDARLHGMFTAAHTGTIASVATYIGRCGPAQSTATCTYATAETPFSATSLSSPVPVTSGQIVQVTVIFSFS